MCSSFESSLAQALQHIDLCERERNINQIKSEQVAYGRCLQHQLYQLCQLYRHCLLCLCIHFGLLFDIIDMDMSRETNKKYAYKYEEFELQ